MTPPYKYFSHRRIIMAFDATFLSAVLDEIRVKASGARIDKIHQPSRDTVILQLKCQEGRQKLIFAAARS